MNAAILPSTFSHLGSSRVDTTNRPGSAGSDASGDSCHSTTVSCINHLPQAANRMPCESTSETLEIKVQANTSIAPSSVLTDEDLLATAELLDLPLRRHHHSRCMYMWSSDTRADQVFFDKKTSGTCIACHCGVANSHQNRHSLSLDASVPVSSSAGQLQSMGSAIGGTGLLLDESRLDSRIRTPKRTSETRTHARLHEHPWFFANMCREEATSRLSKYVYLDGVFLVRSSKRNPDALVLSFVHRMHVMHVQIRQMECDYTCYWTLDEGKTRFYDILQLVEFHQLNYGFLPTKLRYFLTT